MATSRPNAVVTRASEIPPATAPMPEALLRSDRLEGVQNADHRAEQADERCGRSDGGETAEALLQLGVNDRFRALEGALGALNLLFGDRAARTEANGTRCRPAVTTSARCDFLERSATLIASSRRPSFRAPATLGANSRDCLRAAEKYSARSMITASDQIDMMNRMMTTQLGRPAHVGPAAACGLKPTAGRLRPGRTWRACGGCVSEMCEVSENHEVFPPGIEYLKT